MVLHLRKFFRIFRKSLSGYRQLVKVKINSAALVHNFDTFLKLNDGVSVAPVLKSNAYGHGLSVVGKILDNKHAPFFAIDSYYEALILKSENIKTSLVVIGYTFPENILKNKKRGVIFSLSTMYQMQKVSELLNHPQKFHIKINTGMNRQGIKREQLGDVIKILKSNKNICVDGVFSHLADADATESVQMGEQREVWNDVVSVFKKEFPNISYFHIEATAGTFHHGFAETNVARIGLGLYGIDATEARNLNLLPALSMESIVVGIKTIKKGDRVGYNGTFVADHEMRIAVVPVGYFEGVDRRLSNIGVFKIQGKDCPILGRVSMNMTIIDVSAFPNLKEEDSVCVISDNPGDKNSISNIAKQCATIPYDILVGIPERLRREIIN